MEDGSAKLVGNTGLPQITSALYGESIAGDDTSLYVTLEIAQPDGPPFPYVQEPTLYRVDPTTAKTSKISPCSSPRVTPP